MKKTFKVTCDCGFKAVVSYGKIDKNQVYEVYSCKNCKNLFSVNFSDKLTCPKCKSGVANNFVRYIPEKEKNLNFFKTMFDKKLVNKSKYNELLDYWTKVLDYECPKCNKKTLKWQQI